MPKDFCIYIYVYIHVHKCSYPYMYIRGLTAASKYFHIPKYTTHCNTLQHSATHCNTLQHAATHCRAHSTSTHIYIPNTLPHTATRCNTLQHAATHCSAHSTSTHIHISIYPYTFPHMFTSTERWGAGVETHFQEI